MSDKNNIQEIKKKLKTQSQTYIVESGDNLSSICIEFRYVYGALVEANSEFLEKQGRSSHELLPGDELTLPKYDTRNNANYRNRKHRQEVNEEAMLAKQYKDNRTSKATTSTDSWKSVRIFWGDNNPTSFDKSLPFAVIHPVKERYASNLSFPVHIHQFENIQDSLLQKDLQRKVETIQQAEKRLGSYDEAYKEAIAHEKNVEMLTVPSELEDNFSDKQQSTTIKSAAKGDKKAKKFYQLGNIASAVSQYVIVKVELQAPLDTTKDDVALNFPCIETWAFLQPPSIGLNDKRKALNNQYVVDDAQKSGWFNAIIYGIDAVKDEKTGDYVTKLHYKKQTYANEQTNTNQLKFIEQAFKDKKAYLRIDKKNPSIVWVKYEVIVHNDRSKEDFKRLREQLMNDKKYNDVLSLECGSYMKTWVRNLNYFPNGNEDNEDDEFTVKDENSERLRILMRESDSITTSNVKRSGLVSKKDTGYNPQLYRNHTWRRERLIDGESYINAKGEREKGAANNAKNGYGDLLYVGLYPCELIESLNEIAQPEQPGEPRKLYFPLWLGMTVFLGFGAYGAHSFIKTLAKKRAEKEKQKGSGAMLQKPEVWEYKYGKAFYDYSNKLLIKDLFAIIAVGGLADGFDLDATAARLEKTMDLYFDKGKEILAKLEKINTNQSEADITKQVEALSDDIGLDAVLKFKSQLAKDFPVKKAYEDLKKDCAAQVNIAQTYKITLKVYHHILRFALIDADNKYVKGKHEAANRKKDKAFDKKQEETELAKQEGRPKRQMFKHMWADTEKGPDFKEMFKSIKNGLMGADTKFDTGEFNLLSLSKGKNFPSAMGRPLPGWLAFLFWSFRVEGAGEFKAQLVGNYKKADKQQTISGDAPSKPDPDEDPEVIIEAGQAFIDLITEFKAGTTLSVLVQLQAAWTAALQASNDGAKKTTEQPALNDVKWGEMLKDMFDYLEVSVRAKASLTFKSNIQWQLGYIFELIKDGNTTPGQFYSTLKDLSSQVDLDCPLTATLSVFTWEYKLAEAGLVDAQPQGASFLSNIRLFEKKLPTPPIKVSWGPAEYAVDIYPRYDNAEKLLFGHEIGIAFAYSKTGKAPKLSADYKFSSGKHSLVTAKEEQVVHEPVVDSSDMYSQAEQDYLSDFEKFAISYVRFSIDKKEEKTQSKLFEPIKTKTNDEGKEVELCNMISLSDASSGTDNYDLLRKLHNAATFTFNCYITPPKDTTYNLQRDLTLHLPILTEVRGYREDGEAAKDTLTYYLKIDNLIRDYELVWVSLIDVDYDFDDQIMFRADSNKKFKSWNLMRLEKMESQEQGAFYLLKVPIANLSKKSLEAANKGADRALDLTIKLGYFQAIGHGKEEFLIKTALVGDEEDRILKVPADHYLLEDGS